MGYSFYRDITIDHTKIGSSDLTNYPVGVFGTYSYLATIANGGDVTSSSGFDIVFMDSTGTTNLDFEIVYYDATTGQVEFWVLVPSVSHTSDTVFRVYYGNAAVTTDQSNKHAVWADFGMVHHYGTPSGLSLADSTVNANNGANSGTNNLGGFKITAGSANGLTAFYTVADASSLEPTELTVECWTKPATPNNAFGHLLLKGLVSATQSYLLQINNTDATDMTWFITHTDSSTTSVTSGTGTLSTSVFNHLMATYSTVSGVAKIYVNGVLKATSSAAATPAIKYDSNGIIVYASNTSFGNPYLGSIDELRIHSVLRDQSWITGSYNNQNDPSTFYSISSAHVPAVNPVGDIAGSFAGLTISASGGALGGSIAGTFLGLTSSLSGTAGDTITGTIAGDLSGLTGLFTGSTSGTALSGAIAGSFTGDIVVGSGTISGGGGAGRVSNCTPRGGPG